MTQGEVMNRASVLQRQALPIDQFRVPVEAIQIQVRIAGRVCYAEVEHFACLGIELWVSAEGSDIVKSTVKIEGAAGFEG